MPLRRVECPAVDEPSCACTLTMLVLTAPTPDCSCDRISSKITDMTQLDAYRRCVRRVPNTAVGTVSAMSYKPRHHSQNITCFHKLLPQRPPVRENAVALGQDWPSASMTTPRNYLRPSPLAPMVLILSGYGPLLPFKSKPRVDPRRSVAGSGPLDNPLIRTSFKSNDSHHAQASFKQSHIASVARCYFDRFKAREALRGNLANETCGSKSTPYLKATSHRPTGVINNHPAHDPLQRHPVF